MITGPARSAAAPKLRHQIQHSARKLGSHKSLNITGTGTARVDVNGTFEFDWGPEGGVTRRQYESIDRALQQKKRKDELISDSEIEYLIEDKLRREQHAVECLFRNADPAGNGRVSKGALLKILYSVCGHLRVEQFHRLLERLGLDELTSVSFDEFRGCFAQRERRGGGWQGPQIGSYSTKPVSVPHAFTMLRQRAQQAGFEPRTVLPPACLQPGGVVLKPQFKEVVEAMRIPLAPGDFDKLWDRFDFSGTGAVGTAQLLSLLGAKPLQQRQPPRSRTAPVLGRSHSLQHQLLQQQQEAADAKVSVELIFNIFHQCIVQQEGAAPTQRSRTAVAASAGEDAAFAESGDELKYLRRYELLRRRRPVFEHFVDTLHYSFDEAYNAFLVTFRHFDSLGDGCVSMKDFRSILKEFGFPVSADDAEQFLVRFGLRAPRGSCRYEQLLDKLQARGHNSLLCRYLLSDRSPLTAEEPHFMRSREQLSPYQLELQLLRFFHRDYLQLHSGFVREDASKLGVVSESAFRSVLSRLVKDISEEQLEEAMTQAGRGRNGGVMYRSFLEQFHVAPNSWNRRLVAGREIAKVTRPATPPQLESLLQRREAAAVAADAAEFGDLGDRSVSDICLLLEANMRNRFHQVDKLYKQMDRRNTGRISRKQFACLLQQLGIEVSDSELDSLWQTLDTNADGLWSYRQMVRLFMTNLHERAHDGTRGRERRRGEACDPNVLRLRQLRTQRAAAAAAAAETQTAAARPPAAAARPPTPPDVSERRVQLLIDKCRPAVVRAWDELKRLFRHLDPQGTSFVQRGQFQAVVQEFKLPLTPTEIDAVSKRFCRRSDGRFNYLQFLQQFVKKVGPNARSKSCDPGRTLTDKRTGNRLQVEEIVSRIREKLLFEWKSLLLAFRKYDREKCGLLSEFELRRIVQRCGYSLSEDDMFTLLSEFDLDFDGKVNYQEFVMQLLDVAES